MILNHNGKQITIKTWAGEKLSGKIVLDTETTIAPFHKTPDLCLTQVYALGDSNAYAIPKNLLYRFFNKHHSSTFILLNAPFDMDVLSKAMEAPKFAYELLDECRVHDIGILYRLWHLGVVGFVPKKWSMEAQLKHLFNVEIDKTNTVRTSFELYKDAPLEEIPQEYIEYAFKDVLYTADIYNFLMPRIEQIDKYNTLLSHDIQAKGDLALAHIHKNGIKFDLKRRDSWLAEVQVDMEKCENIMASWGFVRGVKGNQQALERILTILGISDSLPRTETNQISTTREDLEPFYNVPFVKAYLDYMEMEKATTFVRNIETERVHPKYSLLMNTGRTSASAPNIQNMPRVGGIREMFIPDDGKLLVDIDYTALELAGLAQVCITEIGFSNMADLINEGRCLHYYTASNVYNKPESEITKEERQFGKIPNFSFPTNMSPNTFIDYCNSFGVPMTLDRAQELKDAYARTYPEISEHFWKVPYGLDYVYTLTGRLRAGCTYTALLNTKFQGLCADGAKLALYNVDKAGYKIVAFVHDQVVIEVESATASDALDKVGDIMVTSMKEVIPDVKISVEGEIRERWGK